MYYLAVNLIAQLHVINPMRNDAAQKEKPEFGLEVRVPHVFANIL